MGLEHQPIQRREVRFWGHVQGVGFRYTTQRLAARFDVSGFVQNLADGRVLLVVEGTSEEIDRFMKAIMEHLGDYISGVESRVGTASGQFRGFGIEF